MTSIDARGHSRAVPALLASVLWTSGCPQPGPSVVGPDAPKSVSDTCEKDPSPSSPLDDLGRLLTGPGLCHVSGGSVGGAFGIHVDLELTYDSDGRPSESVAVLSTVCKFEDEVIGSIPEDGEICEGVERHTQQWWWDALGRLQRVEHTVSAALAGTATDREDVGCLFDEAPLTVAAVAWTYDEHGRVQTSNSSTTDCSGTESIKEALSYGPNTATAVMEVVDGSESTSESTRFEVDRCGRVLAAHHVEPAGPTNHYVYDERGRLVSDARPDRTRRWSYPGILASDSEHTGWTLERDQDNRTLYLSAEGAADDRFVIRLDERQRVVVVESQHESWTLSYDDCPNTQFATHRWRVGAILSTWPFPATPLPGEGNSQLDFWLYDQLPLDPMAL